MTRQRPKCQVCGNGIHVAMFGRQWVHWSHLLDLDHKAVPPEPSQREAQDGSSGAEMPRGVSAGNDSGNGLSPFDDPSGSALSVPEHSLHNIGSLPLTARQFDTIEAGYERIWRRYA